MDDRVVHLKGRSWSNHILSMMAHDDEAGTGHVFRINDDGESVCECGKNIGIVKWETTTLYRTVCECGWRNSMTPYSEVCPECGCSLEAV